MNCGDDVVFVIIGKVTVLVISLFLWGRWFRWSGRDNKPARKLRVKIPKATLDAQMSPWANYLQDVE